MTNKSTIVKGRVSYDPCNYRLAWLSAYIYHYDNDKFKTDYPDQVFTATEKYWVEEELRKKKSGLMVGFFRPKNAKKYDKDFCPPTLVFRGTDFEDFRGVGISTLFDIKGFAGWVIDRFSDALPFDFSYSFDPADKGRIITREILASKEWQAVPLLNEREDVSVPMANRRRINITATLDTILYLDTDGDWANNILQGMGMESKQYQEAIKYARKKAELVLNKDEKLLCFTGHSLGGGLASAAATVVTRKYPKLRLRTKTFNSAGVHKNTVAPYNLSDAIVRTFAVKNEILTMMQSYAADIPFVGGIFRLARREMQPAIGTMRVEYGTAPPSVPEWIGKKGEPLPVLFPLSEQTLIKGATFERISAINNILNNSITVGDFAERFLVWFEREYLAEETGWIWDQYSVAFERLEADLQPELAALRTILSAAVEYHVMDYVIASYEETPPAYLELEFQPHPKAYA